MKRIQYDKFGGAETMRLEERHLESLVDRWNAA